VADREIWPLGVGVALATFTEQGAAWGLGLIALLWLIRWIGRGHLTQRTPVDWPVGLLLLMLPVTFYATTDSHITFIQISRLVSGLALMYGLINWVQSKAQFSLLTLGLTALGLALVLIAPISVTWPSKILQPLYGRFQLLVSDTINPNMMAGSIVMLLPFPAAMLILAPTDTLPSLTGSVPEVVARLLDAEWFRRVWYGAATLLMLFTLFLTQSRGGWLAGVVVIYVILIRRWRRLLWLIPITLLGLGVLTWRQGLPTLLDWIGTSGTIQGWDKRVEIWSRALYMIQDFPFTGIGTGTFQSVANVLYPFFLAGPNAEIPHAHNLLLQVAVDLGIPGLIAFASIVIETFWCSMESVRPCVRTGDEALSAVAWAGLASMIGLLVHGLVDSTTWLIGRNAFILWAVIGTIVALEVHTTYRGHEQLNQPAQADHLSDCAS
jgi:putative inorganic carbon (HCO3(-)) transporter